MANPDAPTMDERFEIPADAFILHGTEAALLLAKHRRGVEPILAPTAMLDAPPMSLAFDAPIDTREVCLECREPWERWGCPTRRAVLLTGIYRREWKKQQRIAERALGWLAEVGSVADWRADPAHGTLEFKMLVAKDVLLRFRGDYLHAVLQRAHDAFKDAIAKFSKKDAA